MRWLTGVLCALVVLLGLAVFAVVHRNRIETRNTETALRDDLATMRRALDNFREDHGKYPESLEALVPNYLRKVPVDPITKSGESWRLVRDARTGEVLDVKSGARGRSQSGEPYSTF